MGAGTHPEQLLLKLANAGPSGYIFAGTLAGTDPHSCSLPERMQGTVSDHPIPSHKLFAPCMASQVEDDSPRKAVHTIWRRIQCGWQFWCVHRCLQAPALYSHALVLCGRRGLVVDPGGGGGGGGAPPSPRRYAFPSGAKLDPQEGGMLPDSRLLWKLMKYREVRLPLEPLRGRGPGRVCKSTQLSQQYPKARLGLH